MVSSFPSSQLFTLYSLLASMTSLGQLSLAEFIGEYARPKDLQTQLTWVLIIRYILFMKIKYIKSNLIVSMF